MTLDEAKEVLLKLETLISKTNRLFKKGERLDSMPFLKLHRKRQTLFDAQSEAEKIVREADLDFYRAWVERVIDKPTSWSFLQFRSELESCTSILQQAMDRIKDGQLFTFFIDTAETFKLVHRELDKAEWREAVSHSPYFTEEQRDVLLQKSDILMDFYRLHDEWVETLRSVSADVVNVDKYVQNAYRILWVLPSDLPGQQGSIHGMMREHPTWDEFPCRIYAYTKMFFASFAIQQLYYYRFDKESILSYDNICKNASLADWYDSLQRTAIVHLNRTSTEELRDIVCKLQPNVIITPGTLSATLSALGENNDNESLRMLTGTTLTFGMATAHLLNDFVFVQTPTLTDGSFSVETYMTDICTLVRMISNDESHWKPITQEVNHEIDKDTYLYKEIKEAIEQHCYVEAKYPDAETGTYQTIFFLPCLLKKHAGIWYVIGKERGQELRPYFLESLHFVHLTEEMEVMPAAKLLPYHYAYGVHLRSDLRVNSNLLSDGADLFVVRLRVYPPLCQELMLHPLHHSQDPLPTTPSESNVRLFQYKLYLTEELIRLIRGYGNLVEVLEPQVLREEIKS